MDRGEGEHTRQWASRQGRGRDQVNACSARQKNAMVDRGVQQVQASIWSQGIVSAWPHKNPTLVESLKVKGGGAGHVCCSRW